MRVCSGVLWRDLLQNKKAEGLVVLTIPMILALSTTNRGITTINSVLKPASRCATWQSNNIFNEYQTRNTTRLSRTRISTPIGLV